MEVGYGGLSLCTRTSPSSGSRPTQWFQGMVKPGLMNPVGPIYSWKSSSLEFAWNLLVSKIRINIGNLTKTVSNPYPKNADNRKVDIFMKSYKNYLKFKHKRKSWTVAAIPPVPVTFRIVGLHFLELFASILFKRYSIATTAVTHRMILEPFENHKWMANQLWYFTATKLRCIITIVLLNVVLKMCHIQIDILTLHELRIVYLIAKIMNRHFAYCNYH